jgi:hypothetical protein
MSVNKYKPHIFVLPEDEANSDLANGFLLNIEGIQWKQMQVLPLAGGWLNVLNLFKSDHVEEMHRFSQRFMILLFDFDGQVEHKLQLAKTDFIPSDLADRVFILGALSEPEELKPHLGSYETIGSKLAKDCREETDTTWGHPLLQHNASELNAYVNTFVQSYSKVFCYHK